MSEIADITQGIARIRVRFISLLEERQTAIATHAIAALEATTATEVSDNLNVARGILHQISGSAGSLGFGDLGMAARACEEEIIDYLKSPAAAYSACPENIIVELDGFTSLSENLMRDFAQAS